MKRKNLNLRNAFILFLTTLIIVSVFNYLEKRIQVNSNYYILITDNIKELTKSKNDDNPILGEKIKNLINNSSNGVHENCKCYA